MPKDDRVYVGHMADMAEKALKLATGKTREDFDTDEALSLSLTYLVQVIGEAATRLNRPFRESYPNVRGKQSSGCAIESSTIICPLTRILSGMS